MQILVGGAGGMIGGHLVRALLDQGHVVNAADIKPLDHWWQVHEDAINLDCRDLSHQVQANSVTRGAEQVYDLAEDMGGIGYITNYKTECAESVEIGITMLRAAMAYGVSKFFFSSSACVYNTSLQTRSNTTFGNPQIFNPALREGDAWPAYPEAGYGFSKLYMEELCRHYNEEKGLEVRIARYHNVFGPMGSWNDGREKAPAALCRKVATAKHTGALGYPIWGDGRQLRSYLHVDDCVSGSIALMESDYNLPVNIGSDYAVSVNRLAEIIEDIAGVELDHYYELKEAQGVDGRNADIHLAHQLLKWRPKMALNEGLLSLYSWIEERVNSGALDDHNAPLAPTTAQSA